MNLQALKADNKSEANGLAIAFDEKKVAEKIEALPFALTGGQKRSLSDILSDMRSGRHMNRLLQGMLVRVKLLLLVLPCMLRIRLVSVCFDGANRNSSRAAF